MNRKILISASIIGLISILLGAFGAHGLKALISEKSILIFETGVRYQMYHALMLLFVGNTTSLSQAIKKRIFSFVVIGVILFSGSIYVLAVNKLVDFDFKTIGFLTPIGGLLLIIAWSIMIMGFIKDKPN